MPKHGPKGNPHGLKLGVKKRKLGLTGKRFGKALSTTKSKGRRK